MGGFLHFIVEPGLLSSGPVRTAVLVGTVVAVTSGVVGVLTVIRGQSFAGHSLADVATTGGAGAFLAGVSQFWGFLIAGIVGAAIMELIGVQRRRGRDVATGVVLGAALGAAALFLYLGTQTSSTMADAPQKWIPRTMLPSTAPLVMNCRLAYAWSGVGT